MDRESILCHHEAGHIVVGVALGFRLIKVEMLDPEGKLESYSEWDIDPLETDDHRAEYVAMALAGSIAECRAERRSWELARVSKHDDDVRRAVLDQAGNPPVVLTKAIETAESLLGDRWPSVRSVAARLDAGLLEVAAIISAARGGKRETFLSQEAIEVKAHHHRRAMVLDGPFRRGRRGRHLVYEVHLWSPEEVREVHRNQMRKVRCARCGQKRFDCSCC
jgi:hypothetical protein